MKLRICVAILSVVVLLPLGLFAKCPIASNGRLVLRAPAGNLLVDTSGTDSVEVEVSNRQVAVQESCEQNTVTISGKAPANIGIPDWKIRVPKGITLDLSTQGGNIQVADSDGEVLLRTSGGKVIAGDIKGNATILGTEIRTGNIGGNAELRGRGGRLQIGNVGGNAEFYTPGGDITAGIVNGDVKAVLESGSIMIRESNGDVVISTSEGDIASDYVHGSFDGKTGQGNIRLLKVGSWVKAMTGVGDIFFQLVPKNLAGDLHVTATATLGNITMIVPKAMKATFDVVVEKPAMSAKSIFSDLKIPLNAFNKLIPGGGPEKQIPGGPEKQSFSFNSGGNAVKLRTSRGIISIKQGN